MTKIVNTEEKLISAKKLETFQWNLSKKIALWQF